MPAAWPSPTLSGWRIWTMSVTVVWPSSMRGTPTTTCWVSFIHTHNADYLLRRRMRPSRLKAVTDLSSNCLLKNMVTKNSNKRSSSKYWQHPSCTCKGHTAQILCGIRTESDSLHEWIIRSSSVTALWIPWSIFFFYFFFFISNPAVQS